MFSSDSNADYCFFCAMKLSVNIRPARKGDVETVHELITELAIFEKSGEEVELTEEQLEADAFGAKPIVEIWVAEQDGVIIGAALTYEKYSTWKGRSLHLEDLIVREKYRGKGIGSDLFEFVVGICRDRGYKRMEWQVLDWNTSAIEFYKKCGTEFLHDWLDCRLSGEILIEHVGK